MQTLPAYVVAYKRTPEFTDSTVPEALRHSHDTKHGVWAKIVVLEGRLLYRILEPAIEENWLDASRCGVVEPMVKHEVEPQPGVRFYVEFYRAGED